MKKIFLLMIFMLLITVSACQSTTHYRIESKTPNAAIISYPISSSFQGDESKIQFQDICNKVFNTEKYYTIRHLSTHPYELTTLHRPYVTLPLSNENSSIYQPIDVNFPNRGHLIRFSCSDPQ